MIVPFEIVNSGNARETVRAELSEAKAAVKAEVREELAAARQKFNQELADAKAAVREATIGKVEHMVQGAQDKVRTAGTSMMDTVRENPIPAALIGVGLAWLFLGRRSGRARPAHMMDRGPRRGVDGQFEGYDAYALGTGGDDSHEGLAARGLHGVQNAATAGAHRVSELAQQAGRGVAGMASGAATTVSHLAHDAGSAVGNAAHGIGESVSHLAQGARSSIGAGASQLQQGAGNLARGAASGARRVQTRSSEVYSMNPLAVGAAVLAVGAAVGLAMPRTHVEDEWMGSASDELMDRAEHLAHDALGKVGEAAAQLGGNSGNRSGSDHAQRS